MTSPQIVSNSASPTNGSQGIALATQISVIFDREIDETTANSGTFIVSGPETDLVTGPFLTLGQDPLRPNNDDFLLSPHYQGIVQGTYSFERLDPSNNPSEVFDYSGGGLAYRTKVIFKPNKPLSATVLYTILLAGDEDTNDIVKTGITSRTVFDTLKGPILGTANAIMTGGYLGDNDDTFNIKISSTGKIGEAKFLWWRTSDPSLRFELTTSTSKQLLTDGIFIQFFIDGTSDDDDCIVNVALDADWSVIVKPGDPLEDNFTWSFTTGSGSIVAPPVDLSSTIAGLGDLINTQVQSGFQVIEVTPDIRATNLDPTNITTILIRFNKNIKPGQDFDNLIQIVADAVNGDPAISATGNIAKTITINGDTLTISLN